HIVRGWWKDTGRLEDMLEANRLGLEDIEQRIDGQLHHEGRGEGRGVIEKGARLERTVVRGPAVIGAGAHISDSYIGPYTAIDRDVVITGSEVEQSLGMCASACQGWSPRSCGRARASATSMRGWRRACSARTSRSAAARGCP